MHQAYALKFKTCKIFKENYGFKQAINMINPNTKNRIYEPIGLIITPLLQLMMK